MSFILGASKTGKDAIVFNGHKYRESYTVKNGDVVWRCLGRNCKASVTTNSERTAILTIKETHTGAHPVTMRSFSPKQPQHKGQSHSANTTLSEMSAAAPQRISTLSQTSTPKHSSPSPASTLTTTSQAPPIAEQSDFSLHLENQQLKQEIEKLKSEFKIVLDHSIENDRRLSKYTEEIFENNIMSHKNTQTDTVTDHCQTCPILKEEVKNILNALRTFESENKRLQSELDLQKTKSFETKDLDSKKIEKTIKNTEPKTNEDEAFTVVGRKKIKYNTRNKEERKRTYAKNNQSKDIINSCKISTSNKKKIKIPFKTVTIYGDSHCRNLASLLQDDVGSAARVTGFCAPGAGLRNIVPVDTSSVGDCCVLLAGSNDVSNGNQRTIFNNMELELRRLAESSSVLAATLPVRHDLPVESPVHRAVLAVNRFITKLCSRLQGIELLDLSPIGRRHFTRHGLHLRMSGKRILARMMAERLQRGWRVPRRPTPTMTTPPTTSIIQNTKADYDTFADAVKGITSEAATTPASFTRQTNVIQTNKSSLFLGNPLLASDEHKA